MIYNLSTFEIVEGGPGDVFLAWSPAARKYVALVESYDPGPRDDSIVEVTRDDLRRVAEAMRQGHSQQTAFAMIGVDTGAQPA